MQGGVHQIELHHIGMQLNKPHKAVTERRTENVPATAQSNGGDIFLAAFRFRYGPCLIRTGVTYRTKWDVEPTHQSTYLFPAAQSPLALGSLTTACVVRLDQPTVTSSHLTLSTLLSSPIVGES